MPSRSSTLTADLMAAIRDQIRSQVLPPGSRLPSIIALSDQHGVSTITVRIALRRLCEEGLLTSRPGSGFYVTAPQKPAARRHRSIGCLVGSLNSQLFAQVIAGAEEVATANGVRLVLAHSDYQPAREAAALERFAGEVLGVIAMPLPGGANAGAYATLVAGGTPLVLVDSSVDGVAAPLVASDNVVGGRLATRHLVELGRWPVLAVGGERHQSFSERLDGYRLELEAGRGFDPRLALLPEVANEHAGAEAVGRAAAAGLLTPGAGIFCLNDRIARGAMRALAARGLAVPDDVAVVGFDDIEAAHLDPPLTSLRQDARGLGRTAAEELLRRMRPGRAADAPLPRLPPELVVRESSAAVTSPRN